MSLGDSNNHSISDLLRIAAPDAILRWETGEKESVEKIQSARPLDEKTVSRWKMEWNLRTNVRAGKLAGCLNDFRTRLENQKEDLPGIIQEAESTRGGFCGYPARAISINTRKPVAISRAPKTRDMPIVVSAGLIRFTFTMERPLFE